MAATNTGPVLGVNLTDTPATNDSGHALGTVTTGSDGTRWMYVHANGAISAYATVLIDQSFEAVAITTTLATSGAANSGNRVGIAQVAFADNDYGWVAIAGTNIKITTSTSALANVALYTTTSAGILDDSSAGCRVVGIVAVSANSTAGQTVVAIASNPIAGSVANLVAI